MERPVIVSRIMERASMMANTANAYSVSCHLPQSCLPSHAQSPRSICNSDDSR